MIVWALGVAVVILFAFVLLSPLESLRWWADKGEVEVRRSFELLPSEHRQETTSHRFVVYLSGVGVLGGDGVWVPLTSDRHSHVPGLSVADVLSSW